MKLASYLHRGRESYGAVEGAGIIDLRSRLPRHHTLLDVLRAGSLNEARAVADGVRADFALREVELLPPLMYITSPQLTEQ